MTTRDNHSNHQNHQNQLNCADAEGTAFLYRYQWLPNRLMEQDREGRR